MGTLVTDIQTINEDIIFIEQISKLITRRYLSKFLMVKEVY